MPHGGRSTGFGFTREEVEAAKPELLARVRGASPGSKSHSFLSARFNPKGIAEHLNSGKSGIGVSYVGGFVKGAGHPNRAEAAHILLLNRDADPEDPTFNDIVAQLEQRREQARASLTGKRRSRFDQAMRQSKLADRPQLVADALNDMDPRFIDKQSGANVINEIEDKVEGQPPLTDQVFAQLDQARATPAQRVQNTPRSSQTGGRAKQAAREAQVEQHNEARQANPPPPPSPPPGPTSGVLALVNSSATQRILLAVLAGLIVAIVTRRLG